MKYLEANATLVNSPNTHTHIHTQTHTQTRKHTDTHTNNTTHTDTHTNNTTHTHTNDIAFAKTFLENHKIGSYIANQQTIKCCTFYLNE